MRVGIASLFVLVATVLMGMQGSPDAAATKTKIIALEKAWNQAYKRADTRALDLILDDQIVLINDDGSTQTKSQFLASITQTNAQEQQVSPESMSVHVWNYRNCHGSVPGKRAGRRQALCAPRTICGYVVIERW